LSDKLWAIERDIKDIKQCSGNESAIVQCFTEGYCYEFAKMLERWHPGGAIYFDPEDSHYIYFYLDYYWDIRGRLPLDKDTINRLEEDT